MEGKSNPEPVATAPIHEYGRRASSSSSEKSEIGNNVHSGSQQSECAPPVVVPRLKRRGLFGQFTLLEEVENPKTYSRKKKWFVTFIVAVAGITAPMGSSIFFRKLPI